MASSVGIAATVFDPSGTLFIPRPGEKGMQRSRRGNRRVSRTATLDGGCAYYDTGHAVADRDFTVEIPNADDEDIARAARLVETYGEVTVCCSEGAFLCVPESYDVADGTLTVSLMVVSRLDQ